MPRRSTCRLPSAATATASCSRPHRHGAQVEQQLALDEFPSPAELWQRYCPGRASPTPEKRVTVETPYYDDGSGKTAALLPVNAINRTVEAIARGQNRVLLVMATGTGKTYTAFQIIWRLWKSGQKTHPVPGRPQHPRSTRPWHQRLQALRRGDDQDPSGRSTRAYEIYLSLYQAVTGNEEEKNIYKQFSRTSST
jgi:type I restriction enzyme R subunit